MRHVADAVTHDFQCVAMWWPHADNRSDTGVDDMKVNQTLTLHLFGRPERVRVLAVHRAGTVDVERLSDGKCFRVSGLAA
jgi:hypothetical protein